MEFYGCLEHVEQVVFGGAGRRGQGLEGEHATHYRGSAEDLSMLGVELIEAPLKDQPYPLRHFGLGDLKPASPGTAGLEKLAGVEQVTEQLLDEERIPLGLVDDEVDET